MKKKKTDRQLVSIFKQTTVESDIGSTNVMHKNVWFVHVKCDVTLVCYWLKVMNWLWALFVCFGAITEFLAERRVLLYAALLCTWVLETNRYSIHIIVCVNKTKAWFEAF